VLAHIRAVHAGTRGAYGLHIWRELGNRGRRVVGWSMLPHMQRCLVVDALEDGLAAASTVEGRGAVS
jgi:hypothetical protein